MMDKASTVEVLECQAKVIRSLLGLGLAEHDKASLIRNSVCLGDSAGRDRVAEILDLKEEDWEPSCVAGGKGGASQGQG